MPFGVGVYGVFFPMREWRLLIGRDVDKLAAHFLMCNGGYRL